MSNITDYTIKETANINENKDGYLTFIVFTARHIAKFLKPVEWSKENTGLKLIEDIIIVGHCCMYMSHMDKFDFQKIAKNTLAYFKTGLYDCDKIRGMAHVNKSSYDVYGWVYTPETHNDAGERFYIYRFANSEDAHKCITMLKEIEGELKRLN